MAIKGTAVPDGLAELTAAVENPAVYAWAGELSAGKMSIVLPQGEVKPADGTFGTKSNYTVASEYVYDIPAMGDYRVVLDTENGTVVVYNPETDLKPFEVTWYKDDDPVTNPNGHTSVIVDRLYAIGDNGGWGAGKEIVFTPSMADPQVLVYKGSKLQTVGGQTKFSVEQNAEFDAGGGNGVEKFEQPDCFIGAARNDADGDGKHDNNTKVVVSYPNDDFEWAPIYIGYDVRECWWNFSIWPTTLIIDLRNMQLYAVEE